MPVTRGGMNFEAEEVVAMEVQKIRMFG